MSHWAPAFAGVTGFSWIHDLSFDHSIESVSIQKNISITTIRDHTREHPAYQHWPMSHWAPAFAGVTGFSWVHFLSFDHSLESVSIQLRQHFSVGSSRHAHESFYVIYGGLKVRPRARCDIHVAQLAIWTGCLSVQVQRKTWDFQ